MTKHAFEVMILLACLPASARCDDATSSGHAAGNGGGTAGTSSSGGGAGGDGGGAGEAGAGVGGAASETLRMACDGYCTRATAPMCANDPADCASGCISIGTIDTTCLDSYQAWLTCAANATFTCNGSGQAEPAGCDSEEGDFTTCLEGI